VYLLEARVPLQPPSQLEIVKSLCRERHGAAVLVRSLLAHSSRNKNTRKGSSRTADRSSGDCSGDRDAEAVTLVPPAVLHQLGTLLFEVLEGASSSREKDGSSSWQVTFQVLLLSFRLASTRGEYASWVLESEGPTALTSERYADLFGGGGVRGAISQQQGGAGCHGGGGGRSGTGSAFVAFGELNDDDDDDDDEEDDDNGEEDDDKKDDDEKGDEDMVEAINREADDDKGDDSCALPQEGRLETEVSPNISALKLKLTRTKSNNSSSTSGETGDRAKHDLHAHQLRATTSTATHDGDAEIAHPLSERARDDYYFAFSGMHRHFVWKSESFWETVVEETFAPSLLHSPLLLTSNDEKGAENDQDGETHVLPSCISSFEEEGEQFQREERIGHVASTTREREHSSPDSSARAACDRRFEVMLGQVTFLAHAMRSAGMLKEEARVLLLVRTSHDPHHRSSGKSSTVDDPARSLFAPLKQGHSAAAAFLASSMFSFSSKSSSSSLQERAPSSLAITLGVEAGLIEVILNAVY
jgi:hypothetical protein